MKKPKMLTFILVLSFALAFGTAPVWSQGAGDQSKQQPMGGGQEGKQQGGEEQKKKQEGTKQQRGGEEAKGKGETEEAKGEAKGKGEEGGKGEEVAKEDVKKVQEALKEKGHDPGPIDGILGPKTQAALKSFQQAQGVKATGRIDEQTKKELGIEKEKGGLGGIMGGRKEEKKGQKGEAQEGKEGQKSKQ